MTAVIRRTGITPYTVERRVAGTPAEVAKTVTLIRNSRRLVAMTVPREGDDGRVFVRVRLLAAPAPRRYRRLGVAAGVWRVSAVLVASTAAGYAGGRVFGFPFAGQLATAGGVLLLAWLLLALLTRGQSCSGVHVKH